MWNCLTGDCVNQISRQAKVCPLESQGSGSAKCLHSFTKDLMFYCFLIAVPSTVADHHNICWGTLTCCICPQEPCQQDGAGGH